MCFVFNYCNKTEYLAKMNMKLPDINVKKLVKEAGSTLSRVVQVTFFFLKTNSKIIDKLIKVCIVVN